MQKEAVFFANQRSRALRLSPWAWEAGVNPALPRNCKPGRLAASPLCLCMGRNAVNESEKDRPD
jgi:hypothetical protein